MLPIKWRWITVRLLATILISAPLLAVGPVEAIDQAEVPLPRAKPDRATSQTEPAQPEPDAEPESPAVVGRPVDAETLALCLADLDRLGVAHQRIPAIDEPPCKVVAPLRVTAFRGVDLSAPAVLTCDMARAAATWLDDIVHPEARRLGADLIGLTVAASYICRTRNNQPGAMLSEHGHANALDISRFVFAARDSIDVMPYERLDRPETLFLDRVRSGACHHATTVLGPGSDGFHADHIHLDVAPRRGGYRLCR